MFVYHPLNLSHNHGDNRGQSPGQTIWLTPNYNWPNIREDRGSLLTTGVLCPRIPGNLYHPLVIKVVFYLTEVLFLVKSMGTPKPRIEQIELTNRTSQGWIYPTPFIHTGASIREFYLFYSWSRPTKKYTFIDKFNLSWKLVFSQKFR